MGFIFHCFILFGSLCYPRRKLDPFVTAMTVSTPQLNSGGNMHRLDPLVAANAAFALLIGLDLCLFYGYRRTSNLFGHLLTLGKASEEEAGQ